MDASWKPKSFHMIFTIFLLLLINKINSESLSFRFNAFESKPDLLPIALVGDATSFSGAILLTRRDIIPFPGTNIPVPIIRQHSVGRAVYLTPIHLWNKNTGKSADFNVEFTFVIASSNGSSQHGDGLAFFFAPVQTALHIPTNSSGGYLGLFEPEIAFSTSQNKIVAVELDSFGNEWDPITPYSQDPHVGIDVNSIKSLTTTFWPIDFVPRGSIGHGHISYDSTSTKLDVVISYPEAAQPFRSVSLTQIIDLKTVLPEWVRIGFSAATGDLVETHDIVSWSFNTFLNDDDD